MNETLPLLLSVCALVAVIGGLVAIGVFLVLRFLSRRVAGLPVGILGGLGSAFRSEGEEEIDTSRPSRGRRVNIHDLAENVDFDAALARQDSNTPATDFSAQQVQSGQRQPTRGNVGSGKVLRSGHDSPASPPASGRPAIQGPTPGFQQIGSDPASDLGAPPERPLRQRRRRRDPNEDELFGGMLDDDGDGDLDF